MIKRLLLVALGMAGALQLDRWLQQRRAKWSPNAVTGSMLDKLNQRLEAKQRSGPS